MTPLGKGHQVKKHFTRNWTVTESWWDSATGTGLMFRSGSCPLSNTDKMSSLHPNLPSGWVHILAFGAVNSTSKESLDRTTVGFVRGVLDEKGIGWMVRYSAWALLKDTLMALASFDNNARDGSVIWDGAEFCAQGGDLSLEARRNRGGWWEKRGESVGTLESGPRAGQ